MNEWDLPGETKKPGGSGAGSRLLFCLAVIAMGMIAAAPHPAAILWAPMYPAGFGRALGIESMKYGMQLAYGVPIAIFVGIFAARSKFTFLFFACLLIAYCVVCTKGCHQILEGLSGIH